MANIPLAHWAVSSLRHTCVHEYLVAAVGILGLLA